MKIKNRFFALCCVILIFSFFSCEKEDNNGQGGYDTLSAPVSYDDIILAEETSVYDEPTLEYIVYRVKPGDMIGTIAMIVGALLSSIVAIVGMSIIPSFVFAV